MATPIDVVVVLKFREIYPRESAKSCVSYLTKTISPASQTVATKRITPKFYHGQSTTMCSNGFTCGGVVAERTIFCPVEYFHKAND